MKKTSRRAALRRRTRGTEVEIELKLDGSGCSDVRSPLEVLSTLLEMMAGHGGMDLRLAQKVNHHADEDYAIDDLAMALAEGFHRSLGPRPAVRQFGSEILPVGDALVLVAIDLVSPPVFKFDVNFSESEIDGLSVDLLRRFLSKLIDRLGAGLHVKMLAGSHDMNQARAIFLALGRALGKACEPVDRDGAREVAADIDYLAPAAGRRTESAPGSLTDASVTESSVAPSETRRGRGRGRDREELPEAVTDSPAEESRDEEDGEVRFGRPAEPQNNTVAEEPDSERESADGGRSRRRRGRRGGRGRRRNGGGAADGETPAESTEVADGGAQIRHADQVHSEETVESMAPVVETVAEQGSVDEQREVAGDEDRNAGGADSGSDDSPEPTGRRGSGRSTGRRGRSSTRGGRGRRSDSRSSDEPTAVEPTDQTESKVPSLVHATAAEETSGDRQDQGWSDTRGGADSVAKSTAEVGDQGAASGVEVLDFVTKETSDGPAKAAPRARGGRRLPRAPRRRR